LPKRKKKTGGKGPPVEFMPRPPTAEGGQWVRQKKKDTKHPKNCPVAGVKNGKKKRKLPKRGG